MRKISFSEILVKLGLRFSTNELETAYQQSQLQAERTFQIVFLIFNIIIDLLQIVYFFLFPVDIIHLYLRIGFSFVPIIFMCFYKCQTMLELGGLINVNVYVIYFAYEGQNVITGLDVLWISGFFCGYMQTILMLTTKKFSLKIVSIISFFIAQGSQRNSLNILFYGIIVLVLFKYREVIIRRDFKLSFEAEERLKKFKEMISEDFPIGMLIVDETISKPQYYNQRFLEIFRIPQEEKLDLRPVFKKIKLKEHGFSSSLINIGLEELYLDEIFDDLKDKKLRIAHKKVLQLNAIYEKSEDEIISFDIKIRELKWENSPCYTIVINDVTDKENIINLKKADEYKDHLLASVSHELRTPINGILGMLHILYDKVHEASLRKSIQDCKSCANLLLYFVRSILDMNQIKSGSFQINRSLLKIKDLISEILSIYSYHAEAKALDFKIEIDPEVPSSIYTDKIRLMQILINLITNAFKFTTKGSVILSLRLDIESPHILEFKVSDTGIGIQSDQMHNLFKRFSKLKQENKNLNSEGIGLGLAISNELARKLNTHCTSGTDIKVESEYGKGTTFSFSINIKEDSFEYSALESDSEMISVTRQKKFLNEGSAHLIPFFRNNLESFRSFRNVTTEEHDSIDLKKNQKILVVDDNPFNLKAITYMLSKLSVDVSSAQSGHEAIEYMKNNNDTDLIIMDIQMPILDGFETTAMIIKMLKQNHNNFTKIVGLTASGETVRDECLNRGMVDCFHKPVNEDMLRSMLSMYAR